MPKSTPISIMEAFAKTRFLANRKPTTAKNESKDAFAILSEFRDGAIFIANYAGNSEWERHSQGDELVMIIEGETRLLLWEANQEKSHQQKQGELLVVPQNIWHRFETANGVKALFITPQPTDHRLSHPSEASNSSIQ